jgi:NAD(P)-dependent dehydrogenase (short-subunit alcohol dehydrogenase family)
MATVFITGGNRGIGLALAERYVARGDLVYSTYRSTEAGAKGATLLRADVTDPASLEAAAKALSGKPLDLLICNAGANDARGGIDAPGNTPDAWMKLLGTNVAGVFFTVRALTPHLSKAKGKIAVISSRMGSSAAAGGNSYAYRATKAAASNLAANLAVELKPHGVAIASYHPGWVKTDMGGQGADIDVATSSAGLIKQFDALSLATTGAFKNYDGTSIPF